MLCWRHSFPWFRRVGLDGKGLPCRANDNAPSRCAGGTVAAGSLSAAQAVAKFDGAEQGYDIPPFSEKEFVMSLFTPFRHG